MDTRVFLKEFGLSGKEIDVYLALLKGGAQPVRKIAATAGVNRGTTYDILKGLTAQGLVSYLHRDKHQHFVAESPDVLTRALFDKEQRVASLREQLDHAIPVLKSMYDRTGGKPVARFYEGKRGLGTILSDVLDVAEVNGKEYVAYSVTELRSPLYAAYPSFTKERIKRGVRVRVIAIGEGGYLKGLDERRWIARGGTQKVSTYTLIYGKKIALISVSGDNEPFGLIIEDPGIAATQRFLFDWTWGQLEVESHASKSWNPATPQVVPSLAF